MVGFGTAGLGNRAVDAPLHALKKGFTHLDTAAATEWYSEAAIGQALQRAGKPRDELFVTTKIHPRDFGYEPTLQAFAHSLAELSTPYVDLLLLHTSDCADWSGLCQDDPHRGNFYDSWRALETLYKQGKVRAIGVSNFRRDQLEALSAQAVVPIQAVQNWMDPLHPDRAARQWCQDHGVLYTSYSTLGSQWQYRSDLAEGGGNPVLTHPVVLGIAEAHHTTPVLVVLSWAVQEGVSIIPRSSNHRHIDELATLLPTNDDGTIPTFLTPQEMEAMRGLAKDGGHDEL